MVQYAERKGFAKNKTGNGRMNVLSLLQDTVLEWGVPLKKWNGW